MGNMGAMTVTNTEPNKVEPTFQFYKRSLIIKERIMKKNWKFVVDDKSYNRVALKMSNNYIFN